MARPRVMTARCGLVQVIRLCWTKASRGGKGARARNAVPAAFEVPAAEFAGAEDMFCVDALHWGDGNAFAASFSTRRHQIPLAEGFTFGCVAVTANAEGLQVCYRYDPANGGAPDRRAFAPVGHRESVTRTLLVRDGEWVRVCYNGRFSNFDADWWYQQVTVNVAWFAGEPDGRVFLDRKPAQELISLADLW